MDRAAIHELFDYVNWAWERLARAIESGPAEAVFTRPVDGSGWPRIADCCWHSVSAYDGWLNGPWGLGDGAYIASSRQPIESWGDFKQYRRACTVRFQQVLNMGDGDLYAKRRYDLDPATPEMLSPADVLTNLVLHERGHHGDLNTLFHQLGLRSHIIDYRYHVSRPAQFVLD